VPGIGSVQIELARNGLRDVLKGPEVQRLLADKARAVERAASSRGIKVQGTPGDVPLPVEVHVSSGTNRARAVVVVAHPAGLAVESKHRVLGGALDAARSA
jgi:hypothetical protein